MCEDAFVSLFMNFMNSDTKASSHMQCQSRFVGLYGDAFGYCCVTLVTIPIVQKLTMQ